MDRPAPKPSSSSRIRERPASATDRGPKARLTVDAILDKLDAADDSRFRNRRSGDRVPFRRLNVPVKVTHPGGSSTDRVVATRNLSSSGIGFLYDSFLYNGTRVVLRLPRRLGGEDALCGKVVYCAHVSGAFHQVGVRFDQKIFAKLYANDATAQEPMLPARAALGASVTPLGLSGQMLVIDSQSMDSALVSHHLRETGLRIVCVPDGPAAAEAIAAPGAAFNVVLCEMNVEAPSGQVMIELLRNAGYGGPIFAAAAVAVDANQRQLASSLGAAALVSKPYDRAELMAALAGLLTPAAATRRATDATDVAVRAVEQGVAEVRNLVDVCRGAGQA